jgi:ATP synthase protein I
MADSDGAPKPVVPASARHMMQEVASRAARLKRPGETRYKAAWRAAATIGLIGWTVVLPMLAGIAVGNWIDRRWPGRYSWTLMLLVGGLMLGCVSAWNRITDEQERH